MAVVTLPKKFNVRGKNVILVDDMIDTAGTLVGAAEALHRAGARAIYAVAAHGVLSGPAIARIKKSPIKQVIITDTFPLAPSNKLKKIKIVGLPPTTAVYSMLHRAAALARNAVPGSNCSGKTCAKRERPLAIHAATDEKAPVAPRPRPATR